MPFAPLQALPTRSVIGSRGRECDEGKVATTALVQPPLVRTTLGRPVRASGVFDEGCQRAGSRGPELVVLPGGGRIERIRREKLILDDA
jgi:hypothetical protein